MKKIIQILGAVFCLTLGACSGELEPKEQAAPPPIETMLDGDIHAEVIGEKESSQYRIVLSWKKNLGAVKIIDEQEEIVSSMTRVLRTRKAGGHTYSFEAEQLQTGVRIKFDVEVPKDIVIAGKISLVANHTIQGGRLFIFEGAEIQTNEFDLTIEVAEISSRGAIIQNFAPDAEASLRTAGKNGGHIRIKAKRAIGKIDINMRGENGGRGAHGAPTEAGGCPGTDGKNGGNSGSLFVEIEDTKEFRINANAKAGLAGKRGLQGVGLWDPTAINPPCAPPGTPSFDGEPGQKGLVCLKLGTEGPVCD